VIDIGLPGLDGYEVGRRIRSDLGSSVRLIALTGYGQAEDRRRSEGAGFDMHLVKPVTPEQIRDALETVMGIRINRSQIRG
jgi:CheY-like chemotaxis protein